MPGVRNGTLSILIDILLVVFIGISTPEGPLLFFILFCRLVRADILQVGAVQKRLLRLMRRHASLVIAAR